MAQRKRGQKAHLYRPFTDIFEEITPGYEQIDHEWATQVQQPFEEGNPELETELRLFDRKEWVWGSLVTYVVNGVDVYPGHDQREFVATSNVVTKRLVTVFMVYNSPYCMRAFRYYNGGITSEVRGWALEHSVVYACGRAYTHWP